MSRDLVFSRRLALAVVLLAVLPAILTAQARSAAPARRRPSPKPAAAPSPNPEPTPSPGWQTVRNDAKGQVLLSRPSQEVEMRPGSLGWRDKKTAPRASLFVICTGTKLDLELAPAADGVSRPLSVKKEPVLLRLDQDKAFEQSTGRFDFVFQDGLGLVKKLLAHDWLVLRYVAHDGYRENTFDLAGLDAALAPVESPCGLTAGTVAAATAGRPTGTRPPPPPLDAEHSTVGAWNVLSRVNRFDDSRTVAASVDSVKPLAKVKGGLSEPAHLIVRALGGSIEAYVTFPFTVSSLEAVSFDGAPPQLFNGDMAAGNRGLFLSPTRRLLREIAKHRRMVVTAKTDGADLVAEFDLADFDKVAPRVLEAAGQSTAVLVDAPRTGKWQTTRADGSSAILRLEAEGAAGGPELLIACRKASEDAFLVAPGITEKSAKGMTLAFDGETPQKTTMYPHREIDLLRGEDVMSLSVAAIRPDDLRRHKRLTVHFNKLPSDVVFDLTGLETWREPLEEAGCKGK